MNIQPTHIENYYITQAELQLQDRLTQHIKEFCQCVLVNTMMLLLFILKMAIYVKDYEKMYHCDVNAFIFVFVNMVLYFIQIIISVLSVLFVTETSIQKWKNINNNYFYFTVLIVFLAVIMVFQSNEFKSHIKSKSVDNYEVYRVIILMIWIRFLQFVLVFVANLLIHIIQRSNDELA